MHTNLQRTSLLVAIAVFGLAMPLGFFVFGKFIPPHLPSASAAEIAAHYAAHTNSIRVGVLICLLGTVPWYTIVGVLYAQLRRIERANGEPAFVSVIQVAAGGPLATCGMVIPFFMWATAAFRPDRDPDLILLLNDLGWISFVLPFTPFIAQNVAIAIGVLRDRQPRPLLPRWFGWLTLWVILTGVAAFLILFFKTGPFAWNGLIAFWIPLPLGWAYLLTMVILLLKAFRRDDYPA